MNLITRFFIYPLLLFISILPFKVLYFISDLIFYLSYYIIGFRRKIVRKNLELSKVAKSKNDLIRIEKEFYRHFTDVFFEMLKYAYMEQRQLEWAFKTTYLYVEKEEQDLIQISGFKPDNYQAILDYMDEAKPYSSKIREYRDGKSPPMESIGVIQPDDGIPSDGDYDDISSGVPGIPGLPGPGEGTGDGPAGDINPNAGLRSVSDYDKPPYPDPETGTIKILDDFNQSDREIMATSGDYINYFGVDNKANDPIRHNKVNLTYDRTNWRFTEYLWNSNTTSLEQSITNNVVNLSSQTAKQVSANTNVRAIDRIFKFDPVVVSQFNLDIENNYGITFDNLIVDFIASDGSSSITEELAQKVAAFFPSYNAIKEDISSELSTRYGKDVTPNVSWIGMKECVFGSMVPTVDDKIRIVFQMDNEPGLIVRGDEDLVDFNDIVYIEIDTVGLFGTSVSVNDIKNTTQFTVYPNPANDYTSIAISLYKTEKVILTIVDLLGKEISKEEKVLFSGKTTERLDVSNFQNGVYFINLQVGSKITTQKLVITK